MKKILSILLSAIILLTITSQPISTYAGVKAPRVASTKTLKEYKLTKDEKNIFELTNKERAKRGLKEVKYSKVLHSIACQRAREASKRWSHTRPNGTFVDSIFIQYKINYKSIGENLFSGTNPTPAHVVDAWMHSPSHKAIIVSKKYTHLAVGSYSTVENGVRVTYYCQIFYKG